MKERKRYKPGQLVTINDKLFRFVKPKKRMIGVCHKCDLAKEPQPRPGCICHEYCYRLHGYDLKTGMCTQYYLKRVKK